MRVIELNLDMQVTSPDWGTLLPQLPESSEVGQQQQPNSLQWAPTCLSNESSSVMEMEPTYLRWEERW